MQYSIRERLGDVEYTFSAPGINGVIELMTAFQKTMPDKPDETRHKQLVSACHEALKYIEREYVPPTQKESGLVRMLRQALFGPEVP